MGKVLKEVGKMGNTKARVVMINIEEMQTQEIYSKLLDLSEKDKFDICTLIAFKIQCSKEKPFEEQTPERFDMLVNAARSRYIFLTESNRTIEKQKLPPDQQLQESIHNIAKSKENENGELELDGKDKKETPECDQSLDSKVFIPQNIQIFSSNEPNKLLFSYFLLDKITD